MKVFNHLDRYLHLVDMRRSRRRAGKDTDDQESALGVLADTIRAGKRVLFITGAGISTASGIPTSVSRALILDAFVWCSPSRAAARHHLQRCNIVTARYHSIAASQSSGEEALPFYACAPLV